MKEIRYETKIEDVFFDSPTVFLAGPTVRGNQPHLVSWRFDAIKEFKNVGFEGNLIIPEFSDKTESDKYRYDLPVWEFTGLRKCHVIMFWIPRTRELIGLTTNCEFGYWMAKDRAKMVYGRPDNSYRNTYLDIMWVEDSKARSAPYAQYTRKCPIYNTMGKTVAAVVERFYWETP